jgi:hypothetical protein
MNIKGINAKDIILIVTSFAMRITLLLEARILIFIFTILLHPILLLNIKLIKNALIW